MDKEKALNVYCKVMQTLNIVVKPFGDIITFGNWDKLMSKKIWYNKR